MKVTIVNHSPAATRHVCSYKTGPKSSQNNKVSGRAQHSHSGDQARIKAKVLSLHPSLGKRLPGWRSQMRLVKVLRTFRYTYGPNKKKMNA